jgi:hypothetical protein
VNLTHFFHLYAAGEWRDAVAEHMAALEDGGYDGPFHVGVVGGAEQRADALEELHWLRPPDSVTEAEDGWEQVTLGPLRAHAKQQRDGAILYAHTKGAANPNTINVAWRRAMSFHVVRGWQQCADALAGGEYDAVGCHWLTPEEYPGVITTPFFGGTFWMASTAYLRKLPACAENSRHDAEMWIGLRNPRVLDLSPGWPGNYGATPKYRRLIAGR